MIKVSSLFSQILSHIPRNKFEEIVKKHGAEKGAKGFTSWTQLVALLFCQLARADSLREICNGLSCCLGKLVHLGINKAPNKSTLSYANEHRSSEMFQELFWFLLQEFRTHQHFGGKMHKFRFKNKLLSLDSTTISLCLTLFPWAKFRRTKGGVKVHVMLDHDDYMPTFVHITEAKKADVKIIPMIKLNPNSIIVVDRAYNDYAQFSLWTKQGVYFVIRQKDNAIFETVEKREIPQNRNIISDDIIQLTGFNSKNKCPESLRRIVVWDEENQREIVLLTNHFDFGSTTISKIYKDRWKIELFFKALKQNLKVKTFIGTTENALASQIWTALIGILLLKWMHHLSKASWSFSNLASMLRLNLFTYRALMEWLHNPFGTPPIRPEQEQLCLF